MHFIIVGNGVAGVTAALTIRTRLPKAEITIISGEAEYFFSRTALMYAFMDRMSLRELEPYERKHWDQMRIKLVRGWVDDLDADKCELRLSDGRILGYDRLLLATGSRAKRPDWPGLSSVKDGVVNFVSLQDLEESERLIQSARETVVVGGGLIGVELVECLHHHGRKVTFLVRDPYYWPAAFSPEEGAMIDKHILDRGVDLRLNQTVAGVEADSKGRVIKVILASGETIPCQLLGIAIGVEPAIDWLYSVKTPPRWGRGIQVDPGFRTSLKNVFAAGDCAELVRPDAVPLVEQIWYSAKRQGKAAAESMLGDPVDYGPPVFFNSAMFFGIEYTTVGQVNQASQEVHSLYWRHPDKEASIRLVEQDGAFTGANMLGSRWDHTVLERWVKERRTIYYVAKNLRQAQFDEEFGRLDLRALPAEWRAEVYA